MIKQALFNFAVQQDARTITVERSFGAPLNTVWKAWTDPDILCKWWAPKPYACVVKSLELRPGGRLLYYMQGPQGDRHWCYFDYETVVPETRFTGRDGFCDENGELNTTMPQMKWDTGFSTEDGSTLVRILIRFKSSEDLEKIIQMGFKEGFSMGLQQLEELLPSLS